MEETQDRFISCWLSLWVVPVGGDNYSLVCGSGLGPPVQAVHVVVPHPGAIGQDLLTLHAQGLAAQTLVPGLQICRERASDGKAILGPVCP